MTKQETRCGQCQRRIRYAPEHAGKRATCPGCGTVIQLPAAASATPAPPAPQQFPASPPPVPQPIAPQPAYQQPAAPQSPPAGTWRCPYCQATHGVYWTSKISGAGWAVAIIMFMLLCWPLFWVGFLMKEQHSYCRTCNAQLT